MSSELWERIRAARSAAQLTQQDIAEKCGVSRVAVGHWESSDPDRRTTPPAKHLRTIADLTGAPLDWLMDDSSEVHPSWAIEHPSRADLERDLHIPLVIQKVAELGKAMASDHETSVHAAMDAVSVSELSHICLPRVLLDHYGSTFTGRGFFFEARDGAANPVVPKGMLALIDFDARVVHNCWVLIKNVDSEAGYSIRRLQVTGRANNHINVRLVGADESYYVEELSLPETGHHLNDSIRAVAGKPRSTHPVNVLGRVILSMSMLT